MASHINKCFAADAMHVPGLDFSDRRPASLAEPGACCSATTHGTAAAYPVITIVRGFTVGRNGASTDQQRRGGSSAEELALVSLPTGILSGHLLFILARRN